MLNNLKAMIRDIMGLMLAAALFGGPALWWIWEKGI